MHAPSQGAFFFELSALLGVHNGTPIDSLRMLSHTAQDGPRVAADHSSSLP